MNSYTKSIVIRAIPEEVFLFHTDVNNLVKISPSFVKVSVLHADPPGLGQEVHIKVMQFGIFPIIMKMKFIEYEYPKVLTDMQLTGIFKSLKQVRIIEDIGDGYTRLTDKFEYEMPFGFLGIIAHVLFVRAMIQSMFTFRQNATKKLLESNS